MTTWAERAERREEFERETNAQRLDHASRMKSDAVYAWIEKHYGQPVNHVGLDEPLRELIAAAVQAEREACAKVAESLHIGWDEVAIGIWPSAEDAAAAIRARH